MCMHNIDDQLQKYKKFKYEKINLENHPIYGITINGIISRMIHHKDLQAFKIVLYE